MFLFLHYTTFTAKDDELTGRRTTTKAAAAASMMKSHRLNSSYTVGSESHSDIYHGD